MSAALLCLVSGVRAPGYTVGCVSLAVVLYERRCGAELLDPATGAAAVAGAAECLEVGGDRERATAVPCVGPCTYSHTLCRYMFLALCTRPQSPCSSCMPYTSKVPAALAAVSHLIFIRVLHRSV